MCGQVVNHTSDGRLRFMKYLSIFIVFRVNHLLKNNSAGNFQIILWFTFLSQPSDNERIQYIKVNEVLYTQIDEINFTCYKLSAGNIQTQKGKCQYTSNTWTILFTRFIYLYTGNARCYEVRMFQTNLGNYLRRQFTNYDNDDWQCHSYMLA